MSLTDPTKTAQPQDPTDPQPEAVAADGLTSAAEPAPTADIDPEDGAVPSGKSGEAKPDDDAEDLEAFQRVNGKPEGDPDVDEVDDLEDDVAPPPKLKPTKADPPGKPADGAIDPEDHRKAVEACLRYRVPMSVLDRATPAEVVAMGKHFAKMQADLDRKAKAAHTTGTGKSADRRLPDDGATRRPSTAAAKTADGDRQDDVIQLLLEIDPEAGAVLDTIDDPDLREMAARKMLASSGTTTPAEPEEPADNGAQAIEEQRREVIRDRIDRASTGLLKRWPELGQGGRVNTDALRTVLRTADRIAPELTAGGRIPTVDELGEVLERALYAEYGPRRAKADAHNAQARRVIDGQPISTGRGSPPSREPIDIDRAAFTAVKRSGGDEAKTTRIVRKLMGR